MLNFRVWTELGCSTWLFFLLLPKPRTLCSPHKRSGQDFFPTSYATIGNRTHVSLAAPLVRDLNPGRFTNWATSAVACSTWLSRSIFEHHFRRKNCAFFLGSLSYFAICFERFRHASLVSFFDTNIKRRDSASKKRHFLQKFGAKMEVFNLKARVPSLCLYVRFAMVYSKW